MATRLGHQLSSIHGTILKYLQAEHRANKIWQKTSPTDFGFLADDWRAAAQATREELLGSSPGRKELLDARPMKRAPGPANLEAASDGLQTPAEPTGPFPPAPTYLQQLRSLMPVLNTAVLMTLDAFTDMLAGESFVYRVAHPSGYNTFAEDSAMGAGSGLRELPLHEDSLPLACRGSLARDLARV